MSRHRSIIERHPLGPTVAANLMFEQIRRDAQAEHHPMRMAIALQFWEEDKRQALQLARLLADIEPRRRDDVTLLFCGRFDVEEDKTISEAELYCGQKFPFTFMTSRRVAKGHPDGCFDLWSGTADNCYAAYANGRPYDNVFFIEADGVPTRFDWIDTLKRQHQATLDAGKYITGPRMETNGVYPGHINGTCVMHMPFWANTSSLHVCPRGVAWDCFHGRTMLNAAGAGQGIMNLYGTHSISLSVFKTIARDYAWIASTKDGSAYRCAKTLLRGEWRKSLLSAWPEPPKPRAKKKKRKHTKGKADV